MLQEDLVVPNEFRLGTPATPSAGTASSRAARSPTLCFLASRSAIRHPSRRTAFLDSVCSRAGKKDAHSVIQHFLLCA